MVYVAGMVLELEVEAVRAPMVAKSYSPEVVITRRT
jgi:hypothetical protein